MPHDDLETRPDPDALLARVKAEETPAGKLTVFLGMSPGVGKTYAMLAAARRLQAEGRGVLAAVIETHGRVETAALLEGMHVLPKISLDHRGHTLSEMDLDGVLQRRPDLVLVDELAHTNAPGSRHLKRWQDVQELLVAGLDVYTTLNVQHLDSQADIVRQITGVTITETVPDSLLDRAHEIHLVDLSVEKLRKRLVEGRVYLGENATAAAENFFTESNLTALRELALRFTADHVDRDLEDLRRLRRVHTPWKTNARLLVGVGPSPYAESLIRWTRRAAGRLGCPWIVAWVEGAAPLDPASESRLTNALALARRLGGEVVSLAGENVAESLLTLARERNVSQLVVGKPAGRRWWARPSLADRLIAGSGEIDVCVVRPHAAVPRSSPPAESPPALSADAWEEYGWALAGLLGLGFVGSALTPIAGYQTVAVVFLGGVVLSALRLSRGPVLLLAGGLALCWNFFFIPPLYTFRIGKLQDVVLFAMFFVIALGMGHLTSQLRTRELAERRRQRETAALLRLTEAAALTAQPAQGLSQALRIIEGVLDGEVAVVLRATGGQLLATADPASGFQPGTHEHGVLHWAWDHRQPAGRFTDTLPQAEALWLPLQTATSRLGVLGLRPTEERTLTFRERQTFEACALQLALVLEKEHFIQAMARAEVLEASEKLRRTLLDSVSHEMKTPLAAIQAALEALGPPDPAAGPYWQEIATANDRLHRVVNHFLDMARLESSALKPQWEFCEVSEVIRLAQEAAGPPLAAREVTIDCPDDLPAVKVDPALLAQALANVFHNAATHTPLGTSIHLTATMPSPASLSFIVRDHGPGLPAGMEQRVFEKFFRAPGTPAGGTGLGLAIVRGLMRAMKGDAQARSHPGGGTEVALTLPVETLHL